MKMLPNELLFYCFQNVYKNLKQKVREHTFIYVFMIILTTQIAGEEWRIRWGREKTLTLKSVIVRGITPETRNQNCVPVYRASFCYL